MRPWALLGLALMGHALMGHAFMGRALVAPLGQIFKAFSPGRWSKVNNQILLSHALRGSMFALDRLPA